MFYIFVLLATLAGTPVDVGIGKPSFDTKEACVAATADFVKKVDAELADQGFKVANAVCLTKEDAQKRIEGATSAEDAAKRIFGVNS